MEQLLGAGAVLVVFFGLMAWNALGGKAESSGPRSPLGQYVMRQGQVVGQVTEIRGSDALLVQGDVRRVVPVDALRERDGEWVLGADVDLEAAAARSW